MADVIGIVNRALLSIGARAQVSSIDPSDGSTEADAAAVLFAPTFESLARAAYWNCLRKQATLSLLWAANGTPENPQGTTLPLPPTPWLYGYQLPVDCLHVRAIVPSNPIPSGGAQQTTNSINSPVWVPGSGQIPFAVAYGVDPDNNPITVVLTNQSQAQIIYTVNQPNPQIWDSQFQSAMVASLAAYFVPALSLSMPLMKSSIEMAQRLIMQARVADGNEGTTTVDHVPDWIRARSAGYGSGPYGAGNGANGLWTFAGDYGAMCWPGY